MKKKLLFIVVSVCMILGFGILIFPYHFQIMLNRCFIGDDYTLQLVDMNDVLKEEDKYTVTGRDAYLVFDLGEEQELLNGKAYLGEPVKQDTDIQLFYADSAAGFSEDQSYFTSIKKGEDGLVFELPGDQNRCVRIDIVEDTGYCLMIQRVTASAAEWTSYVRLCLSLYNLGHSFILYLGTVLLVWMIRKNYNMIHDFVCRYEFSAAVFFITVCVTILYCKYISGEIYYIFNIKDIGADSYCQTYPYLISTARRISNGLWKEIFNFTEGLGNANSSLVLGLNNWITLFGEKNVAYLMGVSQWLKVILTGAFAYRFSRVYGNGHKLSIAAAFGYACNAFVMIRGSWISYPNLALLLIMWLTVYEYYRRGRRRYLLPMATVLFFYSLDIYDCVLWGASLSAYIVFREFSEQQGAGDFWGRLRKVQIQYWCFALAGMADTIINNLDKTLHSHRFGAGTDDFISLVRNNFLTDTKEIFILFLRTIGMTICGVSDYKGCINFLEDPAFYCGILFFLLVPLAVFHMQERKRKFYIFAYSVAGIYILLNPVRYMLNGFAGLTYKLSSLWIIAVIFLTVLSFFQYCFSDCMEVRKKSTVVFNTTIAVTILCMFISLAFGYVARFHSWMFSLGCIAVYGILINLMLLKKISRKITANMLCVCVVIEVLVTSWGCVNGRDVISRTDAEAGMLYNNAAKDAVDYLQKEDQAWYRIEKKYGTVYLSDSLAQDYYGTMSYVGGTGIGSGILDYYFDLELPHSGDHYLYGSGGDIYTGALLGIKYYITKNGGEPFSYGFKYLKTVGDVDIYENTLALPLAYAYDRAVTYDAVQQLTGTEKRKVMMGECIVDDVEDSFYRKDTGTENMYGICKYQPVKKDGKYYVDIPKDHVLLIKIETDADDLWSLYCEKEGEVVYNECYSFKPGEENTIEICVKEMDAIWFSDNDLILKTEFYFQDADTYYAGAKAAAGRLNKNALKVESFSESHIEGQITCDQEMILATSVPYDEKWHIYVDGEQVDTRKVNIGFIGAELDSGEHKVVMQYEGHSWIYDNKFKCIGFLAAVCIVIYGIFQNRKESKMKNSI